MSMNATKHGCCAVDARLLPGESEKDYRNLERLWTEAYNPKNDSLRHMVAELVNADWLLQRATRTHLDIEAKLFAKFANPLDWTEAEQRTLGRFQRYKTAAANHMARCKKAIEDFRKYQQTLEINEERLKTARKKNDTKPAAEMSWKEHLEQMRQQAMALGYTPPERPNPAQR
jgi:guanylate kinase